MFNIEAPHALIGLRCMRRLVGSVAMGRTLHKFVLPKVHVLDLSRDIFDSESAITCKANVVHRLAGIPRRALVYITCGKLG